MEWQGFPGHFSKQPLATFVHDCRATYSCWMNASSDDDSTLQC
ncbi:MAG: hypothetical protein ACI9CE_003758, partial [Flavobacterium sp.]